MEQEPGSEKLPSQLPTEFADIISNDEYVRLTNEQALGVSRPEDEEKILRYEHFRNVERAERERKLKEARERHDTLVRMAGEGEIVATAGRRLEHFDKKQKPAKQPGIKEAAHNETDTDLTRRELAKNIDNYVYYLREGGSDWEGIVASVAENFGLTEDNVRKNVRKKDTSAQIGEKLAAFILKDATIVGDASVIDVNDE